MIPSCTSFMISWLPFHASLLSFVLFEFPACVRNYCNFLLLWNYTLYISTFMKFFTNFTFPTLWYEKNQNHFLVFMARASVIMRERYRIYEQRKSYSTQMTWPFVHLDELLFTFLATLWYSVSWNDNGTWRIFTHFSLR